MGGSAFLCIEVGFVWFIVIVHMTNMRVLGMGPL